LGETKFAMILAVIHKGNEQCRRTKVYHLMKKLMKKNIISMQKQKNKKKCSIGRRNGTGTWELDGYQC
jgi:predicted transcriptional regulator